MTDSNSLLNRLFIALHRSLPAYLESAAPLVTRKDDQAAVVLRRIQQDHRESAARLAELLLDREAVLDTGGFPMRYTSIHDLTLEYLLPQIVQDEASLVKTAEEVVAGLSRDPQARALAQEILGAERAHLEQLHEVVGQPDTLAA